MSYVEGENREQVVMFPAVMDDYIGQDNQVRFIEAFVNRLDLGALEFTKAAPEERGRPAYDPRDLLKLYIYGYLNEIRSSRKLERETKRNVEVLWLLRRLSPDHKTIADFRKDNPKPLRAVFREFTKLCKQLQLFGAELVGIDGSKFRAVNGKERNYTERRLTKRLQWIEEKIEKYLRALQQGDAAEDAAQSPTGAELQAKIATLQERQRKYEALKKGLAESGEQQVSLTDPEARLMKGRQGQHVSYNVQIAVDDKHKLVKRTMLTVWRPWPRRQSRNWEWRSCRCVRIVVTTTPRKSKSARTPRSLSIWSARGQNKMRIFFRSPGLSMTPVKTCINVRPASS